MAILRRTDCFILIWTCIAVLAVSRHCHFQNCPGSKMKPTKNRNVVLFCCHEHVLETMSVELHGRSHPAHNAARTVHYPEHKPCTLTRCRRCNLYGVIGTRTKSAGMAHPTRSLSCPHWAVQMMSYLARAQPAGDLRTAQITLTAPFPPSPLRHAVKCLVGVVGRRVSIISRVSGSQGSRVNGSRGPNGFKGTKNLRVLGFSRERKPPHVNRTVSKVWRFQNPKPSGSKGSRVF